jgi:hypothetical protein
MLAGANRAAVIRADGTTEIIHFRDVTATNAGTYVLSTILRGRRGAEVYISLHEPGEMFVMLDNSAATVRRFLPLDRVGKTLHLAAVARGGDAGNSKPQTIQLNAGVVLILYCDGTNVIQLAGLVTTIDDIGDVVITAAASGQMLRFNGSSWVNEDSPYDVGMFIPLTHVSATRHFLAPDPGLHDPTRFIAANHGIARRSSSPASNDRALIERGMIWV